VVGSNVDSSLPLYWDSPEAAKLFGFSYQDGDDVHKGVQDIITSLTRAQQSHDGYKHFVANIDQAEALITTKYHAEYAGEGIEYSRRYPLASKKGKEKFVDLVLKCTSREVLTTETIRKFSRHARNYMLSYKALEIVGEEGREEWTGDEVDISLDITHKQIKNMQKIIKSHRAALDFDRGFIASALKLAKNLDLKEEIEIGPQKKKRGRKRRHQQNM
jgi:hypothetical protein